jgi:acetyl-CoA decarbonylase/synthase complex subunit gamma
MALTGLEIYKKLPKENCRECGLPTCLAFAMKVAAGQAGLDTCPRLSEESRSSLNEASAPPQRLVTIGEGEAGFAIGQETVLYRHEERFHHPCGIAVRVADNLDGAALEERLETIGRTVFERMGLRFVIDLVAIDNVSGDAARFAACAKQAAEKLNKPLILISADVAALQAAAEGLATRRPLLQFTGAAPSDDLFKLAKGRNLPLGLQADSLEAVVALAEKARAAGLQDLVLSPGPQAPAAVLAFLTQTRRAALQKKFRPLGYPVLAFALGTGDEALVAACWYVLKYAGLVVVDFLEPIAVLALMMTRFNIYTDPQKPVQVEAKLYEVNEPGDEAPVLVTTNFALSFYSVQSEVEAARVPSYILAVDTEGTSVLTAWAADKFNAETIAAAVKKSGLEEKVKHRKLVIPGHVAVISGGLEEESGWKVEVGPKEAVGLTSYLRNRWRS